MATDADTPPQALAELLLAFGAAPGQYPVRLGEPRLLYRELDTVAAWAIGRVPPMLQAQAVPLARAAVLFVQRACFASGNTHYQVLGLPAGTIPPDKLRSRYRALIRLTHPDMAVQGLPPDAAGIVNRAHEVLSHADLRARYDEQLAEQAAERAATRPQRGRVRAEVARIVPKVGWSERVASLAARYPAQVRVLSTAVVAGVAGLGLLSWAARDIDRGRMLVVAEPSTTNDAEATRSALPALAGQAPRQPVAALDLGSPRQAPVALAPLPAVPLAQDKLEVLPESGTRPAERMVLPAAAIAPTAIPPLTESSRVEPEAPRPREPARSMTVALPPPGAGVAQPAPAPAPVPAPAPAPAAAPSTPMPSVPARLAAAAPLQVTPSAARSDRLTEPAGDKTPVAREARPSPTDHVNTAAAVAAPATGGGRVWTVDTVGSLDYFNDIVNALERPTKARQTHRYLRDMKVKGTLLQPALDLMSGGSTLQIERLDVVDVERPGVLNLRGTLVLQASTRAPSDTRLVRYRLNAEFWGTREGTVLGVLDMREAD